MRGIKSIFYGWWIVVAATIGLAVSPGPIAFYSLGILTQPLTADFGWERGDVAFTATILTVSIVLAAPFIGMLIDKVGPKKVLIVSMAAFAIGLWSVIFIDSLTQFYIAYAFIGVGGAGANSLAYMTLLSSWFDRRRGLVMGIAASGMGLGFAIVPMLTQFGVDMFGWEGAYLALGGLIICLGLPFVALLTKDTPEHMNLLPDGDELPSESAPETPLLTGVTVAEAVRMKQYWLILLIFFPVGGILYAMAVNLVPIIREIDATSDLALQAATLLGIGMMVGRIAAGYLFDKIFAPLVTCVAILAAAAGVGILAVEASAPFILLSSLLIGFCSGAEGDAIAFLVSRYFGLRSYGKIYSHAFVSFMIGIAIFPYYTAREFDRLGSYTDTLTIYAGALVIGALALLFLGPFPVRKKDNELNDALTSNA